MLSNVERWNNILSHVRAMHLEFTIIEIAEVIGEPSYYVSEAARELGLKCIKEKDKVIKLIRKYPNTTAAVIAKMCAYTPARIKQLARETGIELKKSKTGPKENLKKTAIEFQMSKPKKSQVQRPPAEYTQSASPYKIATNMNGIVTK